MMDILNTYRERILGWAAERNLIEGSTPLKQLDKLFEELGEFAGHVARGNKEALKDDLGDVFVVLTIVSGQVGQDMPEIAESDGEETVPWHLYAALGSLAAGVGLLGEISEEVQEDMYFNAFNCWYYLVQDLGLTHEECLEQAWNDIKDRKGRMIDGVFVKEADLA